MRLNETNDALQLYEHQEVTHQILNCAFEVHNALGCGFLEKVYERALIHELTLRQLDVVSQKHIKVTYKNQDVGIYLADLIVENKVIVELKTVEFLGKTQTAQVINYLRAAGYRVALLLNFSKPRLEYTRVVL